MAAYAAIGNRVLAVTANPGMYLQLAAPAFGHAKPSCEACERFIY